MVWYIVWVMGCDSTDTDCRWHAFHPGLPVSQAARSLLKWLAHPYNILHCMCICIGSNDWETAPYPLQFRFLYMNRFSWKAWKSESGLLKKAGCILPLGFNSEKSTFCVLCDVHKILFLLGKKAESWRDDLVTEWTIVHIMWPGHSTSI